MKTKIILAFALIGAMSASAAFAGGFGSGGTPGGGSGCPRGDNCAPPPPPACGFGQNC
jgi:hypothetical protein